MRAQPCRLCGRRLGALAWWIDPARTTERLCRRCGAWGALRGVILGQQTTKARRAVVAEMTSYS